MYKTAHYKWDLFPPTFLFVHRERPAVTKSCFCTHYHPFIRKEDKTLTKEQMIRGHWFLQLQKCFREEVASLQNYYYQSAFIAPAFFIAFQHTK